MGPPSPHRDLRQPCRRSGGTDGLVGEKETDGGGLYLAAPKDLRRTEEGGCKGIFLQWKAEPVYGEDQGRERYPAADLPAVRPQVRAADPGTDPGGLQGPARQDRSGGDHPVSRPGSFGHLYRSITGLYRDAGDGDPEKGDRISGILQ